MIEFGRNNILNRMESLAWNGMAKVIVGPRRAGKSFFLFRIFKNHLLSQGIKEENIISFSFDIASNIPLLEPQNAIKAIKARIINPQEKYYVLLDEIQEINNFEAVINELLRMENVDLYVTGSNSKFLSTDIITEFAGRGWVIPLLPLTFKEIVSCFPKRNTDDIWGDYITYGGYPSVVNIESTDDKKTYLRNILDEIYLKDIVKRHNLKSGYVINSLLLDISSSIGSLVNVDKISRTFRSKAGTKTSAQTISNYLNYLSDSFLIQKVKRFDLAGKQFIGAAYKYYFYDLGIRNAVTDFYGTEDEGHLMENAVFIELMSRGFDVDVGIVPLVSKNPNTGEEKLTNYEVDFVARKNDEKYYIQVTHSMSTEDQKFRESQSLRRIKDNFPKIIISKDTRRSFYDSLGFIHLGLFKFLLDESCLQTNALIDNDMEIC